MLARIVAPGASRGASRHAASTAGDTDAATDEAVDTGAGLALDVGAVDVSGGCVRCATAGAHEAAARETTNDGTEKTRRNGIDGSMPRPRRTRHIECYSLIARNRDPSAPNRAAVFVLSIAMRSARSLPTITASRRARVTAV